MFIFLYNFLQNKLAILRQYFNNMLAKNKIKYLILVANISILFILKSNNKLRLYIDYKNLNIITIKNCYLLSLIIKTLNCLYKAKHFIILNLKNVYYCICIKCTNK